MDVLLRLRKKTRHPEKGSVWSLSRHNRASESIPFRPSTASTATRIRMWGAIWIIGPPLSRRAAGRPNPAACPSSRHASSRWRTPDPLQPRPVPWRAPTVPRRLAPPIEAHFDGTPLRATSASSNACSPYATPWLWGAVHTVLPCRPPLPRTLPGGVIEKFACYAIVPNAASVAINRRELLLSRGTCPTVQLTAGSSHARLPKGHDWSASSYSPMDLVRREIAGCDVLVGIYGENYGSIDAESQKSYAELEFDEAVHLGKPVLCFLCRSSHDVQSPSDRQRMQAFLNRLSTGRVVKRVETPEELAIAVLQSLLVLETERNPGGRSQASYSTGAAAEFRYHPYITYQRGDAPRRFVDIFIQDLRNELELSLPQPQMFLDYQRLSGSENYNTATSTAICQSISFIAIITPAYFLSEFAGREWAAFE